MHYYIEFVEPKPGVSQKRFQEVVTMASDRWAAAHPEDELVLNIGRTWRLGPRPGVYMTVWRVSDLKVLQRWDDEFQRARIQEEHSEFTEVATIVDAGLYADLGHEVW
jgi:hypothetical protein